MATTSQGGHGSLDEWVRLLARAGVQTQHELDRAHDAQLARWWRFVRESGLPPGQDWVRATLPPAARLRELAVTVELERSSVRRRELGVALEIHARPVHRFFQAVYETREGAADRMTVVVAAAAPEEPR